MGAALRPGGHWRPPSPGTQLTRLHDAVDDAEVLPQSSWAADTGQTLLPIRVSDDFGTQVGGHGILWVRQQQEQGQEQEHITPILGLSSLDSPSSSRGEVRHNRCVTQRLPVQT